jgi:hypothetical protein
MICRELAPGDILPWSSEEMGWRRDFLDPRTVWVAIDDAGRVVGMIVAAEVHRTLLVLRMLGAGGAWVRPLWRHIRHVCFQRQIASFWTFTDNGNEREARLSRLLLKDAAIGGCQPYSMIAVGGRWDASTGSNTVVSSLDNRSVGSGDAGFDWLRTGTGRRQQHADDRDIHRSAASSTAGSSAEDSVSGRGAERPGEHGRILDTIGIQHGDGDSGGGSIRLKLHRAVFGPGWRGDQ